MKDTRPMPRWKPKGNSTPTALSTGDAKMRLAVGAVDRQPFTGAVERPLLFFVLVRISGCVRTSGSVRIF